MHAFGESRRHAGLVRSVSPPGTAARGEIAWPGSLVDGAVAVLGRAARRGTDVWPLGVLALVGFGVASTRVHRGPMPVGLLLVATILATAPLLAVRRWPLAALG